MSMATNEIPFITSLHVFTVTVSTTEVAIPGNPLAAMILAVFQATIYTVVVMATPAVTMRPDTIPRG